MTRTFVTGCDERTRWQLPWFEDNFYKHMPDEELVVLDFDIWPEKGWFNKPKAMNVKNFSGSKICWLDTDCEILGDITDIWDNIPSNQIGMVEDKPWSARRGEIWHNSGVVAWEGSPEILRIWLQLAKKNTLHVGDQEILHEYLRFGMNRLIHIHDLPNEYNVLRLQIQDKTLPKKVKVMHWTGAKGNEIIREKMKTDG